MTAVIGFFRKWRKESRKEPGYVRTAPYDGRKSVDLDEFVKDTRVKEQIKKLAEKDESQ